MIELDKFEYKIENSDILDKWIEKSRKNNKFIEEWEKKIKEEAIAMN